MNDPKITKIDNVEMPTELFDRLWKRATFHGCTISEYIEQALEYAMANEEQDGDDRA